MNQSSWKLQLATKIFAVFFMELNMKHWIHLLHFLPFIITMFPVLLAILLYEEARSLSQARLSVHLHGPGSTMATSWLTITATIDQLSSAWMWMLSQSLEVQQIPMEPCSTSLKCVAVLASTALHTPVVMS